MKIIALEEHLTAPSVADAWRAHDAGQERNLQGELGARLADLASRRLTDMDVDGVDVQVLSQTTPGTQILPAAEAPVLAREANDHIAAAVAAHPDRFQGLATLPTPDPDAAVAELERAVTQLGFKGAMLCGRTGERNVDHPAFEPMWAAAERLGVPIYIHPLTPAAGVRDAYYSGLGDDLDNAFANFGLGWHYETGIQLLRLVFSGVFDRHPRLQIILGHWGEVVLFYAERIATLDAIAGRERSLPEYLRENVYYTPGGILSDRYLRWTIELVGAERVMFAADYPYRFEGGGASPDVPGARRARRRRPGADRARQLGTADRRRMTAPAPPAEPIAVVIGSTRPTRICPAIARWARDELDRVGSLDYELIDLAEVGLPFLDEPLKAALGQYTHEHTKAWSRLVDGYGGFVFAFPQYNWGYPGVLKNAIDFLYREWRGKPVASLTYGTRGGNRGADQMRQVYEGLHMRAVQASVEVRIADDQVDAQWQLRDVEATMAPYREDLARVDAELAEAMQDRRDG